MGGGGEERALIDGHCDTRFSAVRDAFAENFADRGEVGAAVCVIVGGRTVVDLWGGWADEACTRRWGRETLVNFFSVGKALTALLAARAVDDAALDVDSPVARYWPEFAAARKEDVTVRQVLSHRAGLPAVRHRLPEGAMLDWRAMTDALAAQSPWWEPGVAHGYHVNTFGFLVGEVLRRVTRRSVGELLRDQVAAALDADVHMGLPRAEHARVADFRWPTSTIPEIEPEGLSDDVLMQYNTYYNPSGLCGAGVVNSPEWRLAEIPSTNGHGTARGVARVFAGLSKVASAATLAVFTTEHSSGEDLILRRPSRFGLGFQLTQPERPLGPSPRAFGHFGAGGALGFADPDAGVAFGYVMNDMGPRWQNPRNAALLEGVFASLG